MKLRKNFATLLTIFLLSLIIGTQAFAAETQASEETEVEPVAIKGITIEVINDDGEVDFKSGEPEKYTVTFDDDGYDIGDKIEVNVYVKVNQGYYFDGISKSDIKLTGDDRNASKRDVNSNYERVNLEIRISAVAGELDSPDDVYWDEGNFGYGGWEEVEGATSYRVSINGDSFSVGDSTYVDLRSHLKAGKDNYFKVKATSSKSGVDDSDWTESDELYVNDYYDSSYYPGYSYNPGSSWNGSLYINRGWIQNADGTWYYLNNTGNIHRGWLELSDGTYYLNSDGIMVTGWQKIDRNWYVFDGSGRMLRSTSITSANGLWQYDLGFDGKMQTNYWKKDSLGRWYYVGSDEVLTNREVTYKDYNGVSRTCRVDGNGFLIYGWYWDGSYWYYYQYGTGFKLTDTIVEGRYWLDKNGRWYK